MKQKVIGHLETAPSHPPQCAHWGSLPLLAPFGRHFPLTGGISLPPGEGILTPNPPAQNRRPVINVICNRTHVTIPDINITWELNPTHGPARCQYYVPICSGTGSVTPAFCAAKKSIFNFQTQSRAAPRISPAAPSGMPAFCAAKKSIFNFQTQSRAAPRISPAAPSGITRRRVREAASYNGDRSLRGGGGKPPPYREPPLKERASSASFCSAPSKGKACGRPKAAPTEKEKFSGAGG